MVPHTDWKKYILVFAITLAIFGTTLFISTAANNKRIAEIQSLADKIAVDILSSETQFNLLAESSCEDDNAATLSEDLNALASRLSYAEEKLGTDTAEVIALKRYYSLLEIKDYLLIKKIGEKCKKKPLSILYFYTNTGECEDCEKMGYVLSELREEYPELRVYAFDYNLDLPAIRTLRQVLKLKNELPAIVINEKTYYGFQSIEDIEKNTPELFC
jgi:hypothetical protein